MTAGTRYMAPPKDYSPSELLDPPWVDFVAFVAYPTLVALAVAAACGFPFIRMRRRRRARSGANG